ncbi:hypothetical protein [Streptomyces sp. NPDC059460]|uniref:hypothetical protein n=1 Tax=Streptomyces sp. NPDC059460 TaxID=3346840 RepID=UPI00368C58FB
MLKRPPDGGLVESEAAVRARVGQCDDCEVAFGHDQQLGELAVGRSTVIDGANAVHVSQEPADAEGVAERAAPQFDRLPLHLLQDLGGQNLPGRGT